METAGWGRSGSVRARGRCGVAEAEEGRWWPECVATDRWLRGEAVAGRWRYGGMVMVAARRSGQWVVRGLRGRALHQRPECPTTSVVCGDGKVRASPAHHPLP